MGSVSLGQYLGCKQQVLSERVDDIGSFKAVFVVMLPAPRKKLSLIEINGIHGLASWCSVLIED